MINGNKLGCPSLSGVLWDASNNVFAFVVCSYVIGSSESFKGVDGKNSYMVWLSCKQLCAAVPGQLKVRAG